MKQNVFPNDANICSLCKKKIEGEPLTGVDHGIPDSWGRTIYYFCSDECLEEFYLCK